MMKYIHFASRDNARTPMQWDSTKMLDLLTVHLGS